MYDVRQFKKALYILLIVGVTGFAIAIESPGLWILAVGAILLNAWLVNTNRFVPLPRFAANCIALGVLGFVVVEIRSGDTVPIVTIGQYIVLLHLIKLFEQQRNRDYAQLLVLSLLLMVAAAISTAGLFFGLIFIAYLFLSLYCCLLFHLKSETDRARENFNQPLEELSVSALRKDEQYLMRSMYRLTGLVAFSAIFTGVLVFIFFPRGPGEGLFNPLQLKTSQTLTGFNDQVSFQKVAQITKSDDVVAHVELYMAGQKVTQPQVLLLRGSTLDQYSGNNERRGRWQWFRSPKDEQSFDVGPGEHRELFPGGGEYKQVVTLQPTGTTKLFAIGMPTSITSPHTLRLHWSMQDGVVQTDDVPTRPLEYTVVSNGQLPLTTDNDPDGDGGSGWRSNSNIDPRIKAFARQPAVSGTDTHGSPLAEYPLHNNHSYDNEIAMNIAQYLRNNYSYTLDLTNVGDLGNNDPIVEFLYNFKRGHCEYFAGAMTLMCQSLSIPARMAIGFRCGGDAFNSLGNYFVVRQSDAHAWSEVFANNQWISIDPTSDRVADDASAPTAQATSAWRNLLDYLQYKWANTIVNYGGDERKNLIENVRNEMDRVAVDKGQYLGLLPKTLRQWFEKIEWRMSTIISIASVVIAAIGIIGMIAWLVAQRWILRRRAKRIGLGDNPTPEQLRLAKQLGFYDDLLTILEEHNMRRSPHLTPLEFSQTLSHLPYRTYDEIRRLTKLFYRVRYGAVDLNPHRQRHLQNVVERIEQSIDSLAPAMN